MTTIVHGTRNGWQECRKRSQGACTPCNDANTAYMREYRAGDSIRRRKDRWWNNTRSAALERLVAEYPQRFTEILAEVRAEPRSDQP
jgi:hypothetical protein